MLSVVLATYNEANNIESCLEAVKDWVDEIIVVDGSSTDDTVSIAKRYTARLITTTNKPNFHINKQMAMDAAKGDLVLQLDADEVVDDELRDFITKIHHDIVNNSKEKYQPKAWFIKRKNLFLGRFLKKGGQYPDMVIRLYINGYAKLPQKDVHEQMLVTGQVNIAKGHLIHYSNPTFAEYLRKWNTYTSYKAQQLIDEKLKINFINFIRFELFYPVSTFLSIYIRHKGFLDLIPGLVFAIMSGLYYNVSFLKYYEIVKKNES